LSYKKTKEEQSSIHVPANTEKLIDEINIDIQT
jgi:hypothetical protein